MKKMTKALTIATLTSLGIAATNRITYLLSTVNNKLYNNNSQYYKWKFGEIHYTVEGTGKPLLLIHNLENGASSYEYNKLYKSLSNQYTLYTIDLIGYGKSDKPKITYTAYLYVQLLNDFIKNVVKEPVNILTNGKSNAYATMLAGQDPSLVRNLIYINPSSFKKLSQNPTTKDVILRSILELPIAGTFIYNIISSRPLLKRRFNEKFLIQHGTHIDKYVEAYFESSHLHEGSHKFVYTSDLCNYNNVNIKQALRNINNNIYIIQGNYRDDNYEIVAQQYKNENPSIESTIIKNSKEYPHIENPEAIFELITIYLH